MIYLHSAHPLSPEGLNLLPNFQKRESEGISVSRGRLLERIGDFFEQGEGGIAVVTQEIN